MSDARITATLNSDTIPYKTAGSGWDWDDVAFCICKEGLRLWFPQQHNAFKYLGYEGQHLHFVLESILCHEVLADYCKVCPQAWLATLTGGPGGKEITAPKPSACIPRFSEMVVDAYSDSTINL